MTKLLLVMGLAGLTVATLAAANVSVVGQVTAIDGVAGTFQMQSDIGDMYTVQPPDGFDLGTLAIGLRVQVQGEMEGEVIAASRVDLIGEDGDSDETPGVANDGYYCRTPSARHPALNNLAAAYNEPYADLLHYFCEWHFGVGEIRHGLQTAATLNNGTDFGTVLELKRQLGGWGQVWQHYGLKGGGKK